MDEIINSILELYAKYAVSSLNSNEQKCILDYPSQTEKVFGELKGTEWYDNLKLKSYSELQIIYQALINSNYDFLNSDPFHSTMVLYLKVKLEEKLKETLYSLNIENMNKKIKVYPKPIGYLVIQFNDENYSEVKDFCLASFSYIIHEKDCVNWIAKLKYYVREIKLTKLYVNGVPRLLTLLRKVLKIPVINIRVYGYKNSECMDCKSLNCSIRRINYYFLKLHAFYTNYHCC